jgi:hypothetical protein
VALEAVPGNSCIHTGMGSNKILAPLYDMVPTLSGSHSCYYPLTSVWPYILNLLVKFVSCQLESIKLQMLIKIKTTHYHGSLDNSSHSQLWCLGHLHQPLWVESSHWIDLIVLFLRAVRAILERGDLKGGLQRFTCSPKMATSRGKTPPLVPKKHLFTPKSSCQNILLPLGI